MLKRSKTKGIILQIGILLILYSITFCVLLIPASPAYVSSTNGQMNINFFFLLLFMPVFARFYANIIISPFYSIKKNRYQSVPYEPFVSVIVPAWNEEVGILNTIKSILASTYRNMEIIIVNDGSTDKTDELVKNFCKNYSGDINIKYFYKKNSGKSDSMNYGLVRSEGEIIITIDTDSVVDNMAIENFVECYNDPHVMSVAGNVKIGNSDTFIGLLQMIEYIYGFYFKRGDSLTNSIYIVGGAAASYRRSILDKVGYFDTDTITEDIEMSTRIQQAGGKIGYAANAIVYTEGPIDMKALVKQRSRWKRGRFETFYKYRRLFFRTQKGNKFLTLFVLPIALFAEILLLLEPIFLALFYTYAFFTGNISNLIISIFIFAALVSVQIMIEEKKYRKYYLILWSPVAWLLFYLLDFVEYNALIRSLWSIITKRKIEWQKWQRVGLSEIS